MVSLFCFHFRAQTTARRFQMTKNMFSAAVSPSAALRNEEVY